MTTFEKIRDVLVELLGVAVSEITDDSTIDSLGGDSMDAAQFMLDIEEACGIELYEDDFPNPLMTPVKVFVSYADSRSITQ